MQSQGIDVVGANIDKPASNSNIIGKLHTIIMQTLKLAIYLHKAKPDVVHAVLPYAYGISIIASLIAGVRYRIMSRLSLSFYHENRPLVRFIETQLLHPLCSVAIGNSQVIIDQLAAEGMPRSKLFLLHNGIDSLPYTKNKMERIALRQKLAIADNCLVFITVANLHHYKGHQDVLEAFKMSSLSIPWKWLVVGRDEYEAKDKYEVWAKKHNLADKVNFTGPQSDIPSLLQVADIFILASRHEGFPNSILEAMASSLPVIATRVGGIPEQIEHMKQGILVSPHNQQELSEAITKLAANSELARHMGRKGRERVLNEFPLAQSVSRYEQIYAKFSSIF